MRLLKTYWRLWFVLTVGIIAAILTWGVHEPKAAQWLITGAALLLAAIMFWEMIKTLMSGKFGVDLLAITAVVAGVVLFFIFRYVLNVLLPVGILSVFGL